MSPWRDTECQRAIQGFGVEFCPTREEFCGVRTVEIAANPAVLQFNNLAKAVAKVLEEMGCSQVLYGGRMCVCERRETKKKGVMKVRKGRKKA